MLTSINRLQAYNDYLFNKEFYDDITIAFSCHNIRNNIVFAIATFVYLYPYLKDNIVVFDDNSTDGTKEWLENNGITRITWSEEYLPYIEDYDKKFDIYDTVCYSYKVDVMFNDIFSQVKTKYLLLNDGDVFFFNYFLEDYIKLLKQDYKVIVPVSSLGNTVFEYDKYEKILPDGYLDELDKYNVQPSKSANGKLLLHRAHLFHGLVDLDYLKSIGMLFDPLDDPYLEVLSFPAVCDSGTLFYRDLRKKNVKIYPLDYSSRHATMDSYIIHLGFRCSFKLLKELGSKEKLIEDGFADDTYGVSEVFLANNISSIMNNENALYMIDYFKFNIGEVFEEYEEGLIDYDRIQQLVYDFNK